MLLVLQGFLNFRPGEYLLTELGQQFGQHVPATMAMAPYERVWPRMEHLSRYAEAIS